MANSDALGTLRILEAVRMLGLQKKTRNYQASTSGLYGLVQEIPRKEITPFFRAAPMAWPSSMFTKQGKAPQSLRLACLQWNPFHTPIPSLR